MFRFLMRIFLLCIVLSSCISHKKTVYFQDKPESTQTTNDTLSSLKMDVSYKVKPGDLLFISITSLNKELTEFYNISEKGEKTSYLSFYQIDDAGNVTLPMLGKIQVKDLSLEQVQNTILLKVQETAMDATVIVKLGSFKITVLGDVRAPGIVDIEGEKGTIYDAIALSGDINETGDRAHIKIIREMNTGIKEIIILDLLDKKIINSRQIYLRPNDVVYVEPLKVKATRDNLTQWGRFAGFTGLIYIVINLLLKK
jgi:polysaccharide biosynthesis/export protein